MKAYDTTDGKIPQHSLEIGAVVKLGDISMDHGYRPDADWSKRFEEQCRKEQESLERDMKAHPEDYENCEEE